MYFNHNNFIVIIICNVGSHFKRTYVDLSPHILAVCLVLTHRRPTAVNPAHPLWTGLLNPQPYNSVVPYESL